jgi:hypothetical protein
VTARDESGSVAASLARAVELLALHLTQAAGTGPERRLESAAPAPAPALTLDNGYGVLTRVVEVDLRTGGGPGELAHVGVWFQQTGAVPGQAAQLWFTVAADEPVPFKPGQIVLLTATVQR